MISIIKPASLMIQGLCCFIYENPSLYCYFIRSLGGFLLTEHSYDYPLIRLIGWAVNITWGLPVQT